MWIESRTSIGKDPTFKMVRKQQYLYQLYSGDEPTKKFKNKALDQSESLEYSLLNYY